MCVKLALVFTSSFLSIALKINFSRVREKEGKNSCGKRSAENAELTRNADE